MRKTEDKLEAIFNQRFNEVTEVEKKEDWKLPADLVWDKIEKELHPPKKRNSLTVLLPWMSIAASSLLVLGCFQMYQIQQITPLLTQQIEWKQVKSNLSANFNILAHQIVTNKEGGWNSVKERSITLVNATPIAEKQSTIAPGKIIKKLPTLETALPLNEDKVLPKIKIDGSTKQSLLLTQTVDRTPPNTDPFHSIRKEAKRKSSIYVAATITPFIKENIVSVEQPDANDDVANTQQQKQSMGVGLHVGAKVGKGWMIESGLRYTPSTALDIPLLARKQWVVGNLGLSIKAGLLNRFILQNKIENSQIADPPFSVDFNPLMDDSARKLSNTYSSHLVAGVGVEYALLPRLSLFVEPTFTRSLSPLVTTDDSILFASGKMVDVGVKYLLQ